jgi:mitochondrial import receptor subunit TOM40
MAQSAAGPGAALAALWAVLGVRRAECAGGMTPVGSAPQQPDASAAKAAAAAQLAREQGLAIGTASGPSAGEQLAEASKRREEAEKALGLRPNPGPYDRAEQDAKRVLNPDFADGVRVVINKALSPKLTTTHDFWLGSQLMREGGNAYHFGAQVTPSDNVYLLAKVDPSGSLEARYVHTLTPSVTSNVAAQLFPDASRSTLQGDLEVKGADWTGTLKLAPGPFLAVNYLQSVSKNLALGGEGILHAGQGYTHAFGRAKWTDDKNQLCLTYSTLNHCTATYFRKVNERVGLSAELELSIANKDSVMNMGWEFALRQARVKGTVNSEGTLIAIIEHQLEPGFTLQMNAMLDHSKDVHRFGYGFTFG